MKKNLKIGYLVQQFPPEVGAGPARVTEMALQWIAQGFEVVVITGMPNRPVGYISPEYKGKYFIEENWQGIKVLRSWLYASPKHGFSRTILNNFSFMLSSFFHAMLKMQKVDVLIASSPPFFPHISGAMISFLKDIPLILEVRDLWPDYLVGMGMLKKKSIITDCLFALERYLLKSADYVVVVTESFRSRIQKKGVPGDRIGLVPNGVNLDLYFHEDAPAPINDITSKKEDFIVGYIGNFGAGQSLSHVVDAAAILQEKDASIKFILIGDGPDKRNIVERCNKLNLENVSISPPISKENTRAFYNFCDVCLVPLAPVAIFQETIPSKMFEIMACETPVIASLEGEGKAIIKRSRCGFSVNPGDASAIADSILEMKSLEKSKRREMGKAGRAFVIKNYDRKVLAANYMNILNSVSDHK